MLLLRMMTMMMLMMMTTMPKMTATMMMMPANRMEYVSNQQTAGQLRLRTTMTMPLRKMTSGQ